MQNDSKIMQHNSRNKEHKVERIKSGHRLFKGLKLNKIRGSSCRFQRSRADSHLFYHGIFWENRKLLIL